MPVKLLAKDDKLSVHRLYSTWRFCSKLSVPRQSTAVPKWSLSIAFLFIINLIANAGSFAYNALRQYLPEIALKEGNIRLPTDYLLLDIRFD